MSARRAPRRLDPHTRSRVMQVEAWRHIGKKHAYLIAFGPYILRLVLVVLALVGLMVLWFTVPHVTLGVSAIVLAVVTSVVWLALTQTSQAVQRRMIAHAKGQATRAGAGLGWAVATLVVMLGATGWLALGSPWA